MLEGAEAYFRREPELFDLYQAAEALLLAMEGVSGEVQRSQITFRAFGRDFAALSVPYRRKKEWPDHCLLLTFGLGYPLNSPRIAVQVEPYPGRFTHHMLLTRQEELDGEVLGWLEEARAFSASKRAKGGSAHANG